MLKILQARFQQYVNRELPDVQAGFRKGRGTRHQIANIHWIIEKASQFQKNIYFCFIDSAKAFHSGSQQTVENSSRDGNTRPLYLTLEKFVCRSRSSSWNYTCNNRLVPSRKRSQGCILSPCLFNYMQSTSCEMKHKLESRLPGEISITSDMQMTPPLWVKKKVKKNQRAS